MPLGDMTVGRTPCLHFEARQTIPIGLPPGQLHRDKPAALLCFNLVQAPLFELALQGAQRQTLIPAKLVLSQSTRFKKQLQELFGLVGHRAFNF
jgi:hypothetical protein